MSRDSKIIYKINKEKRVIVCTVTDCTHIATGRIYKYAKHYMYEYADIIKDKYVGVAKCSPEDEWDEEKGKRLALIRAKRKRSKDINRVITRAIQIMKREIEDLEKYAIHKIPDENEVLL